MLLRWNTACLAGGLHIPALEVRKAPTPVAAIPLLGFLLCSLKGKGNARAINGISCNVELLFVCGVKYTQTQNHHESLCIESSFVLRPGWTQPRTLLSCSDGEGIHGGVVGVRRDLGAIPAPLVPCLACTDWLHESPIGTNHRRVSCIRNGPHVAPGMGFVL